MHNPNQDDLLRQRRFAPFFWTQFLGAGNDNVYKNALIIFAAFHAASMTTLNAQTIVNLAGAMFVAPFVLLSASAGQIADKFEKSRLIRYIKVFEIVIMAIGFIGFWQRNLTLLMIGLMLMGVHSTIFGPVKYAILPQHLKPDELVGGNGLVEMGTIRRGFCSAPSPVGSWSPFLASDPSSPGPSPFALPLPATSSAAGFRTRLPLRPISSSTGIRSPRRGKTCALRKATVSSGCRCSASRGSGITARSASRAVSRIHQGRARRRRALW